MGKWIEWIGFQKKLQIASKHTRKCSTSLAIKENANQNNEIPSHPSQNGNHQENIQRMLVRMQGGRKFWYTIGRKLVQPLWNSVWRFLKKLKLDLQYDPTIPLFRIYLKECKSSYNRNTCTLMSAGTLFRIAKLWNQPRYPSTGKWIKKM
jgi:hypothetical protein